LFLDTLRKTNSFKAICHIGNYYRTFYFVSILNSYDINNIFVRYWIPKVGLIIASLTIVTKFCSYIKFSF